ncbi:MAG: hypothetical protein IJT02_08430 [Synergistaceae bacterium]|nr:hypothetical protein [Synergistaceae bacterium]
MTDFLFARPTFWSGMGAVLDLGGTMVMFNESASPEEADNLALANDWAAVGNDIRSAMAQVALA